MTEANDGQTPTAVTVEPKPSGENASNVVDHAIYAGLQKRYEVLNSKHTDRENQVKSLGEQVADLQSQLSTATQGQQSLTETLTGLQATVAEKDKTLTALAAEKSRWGIASTEFPNLAAVSHLVPVGEEDAMRTAFKELSAVVDTLSEQKAKDMVVGTTPPAGGGRAHPAALTNDELQRKLFETAGSEDYQKYADILLTRMEAGTLPSS